MRKEKTGYIVVNQQTLAGKPRATPAPMRTSIADMAQIKIRTP